MSNIRTVKLERNTINRSFIVAIVLVSTSITLVNSMFSPGKGQEQPAPATVFLPGVQAEQPPLVVPIAGDEADKVVQKQGQTVTTPDGKSHVVLGVVESPKGGCQAVLMGHEKVPCSEFLGWLTNTPSVQQSTDR
jgi:hypothetical protein